MSEPARMVVTGAGGRMGQALVRAIDTTAGATLHAAIEREGSPAIGKDCGTLSGLAENGIVVGSDAEAALDGADVLVDFTAPQASVEFAKLVAEHGIAHVIGTTGMGAEHDAAIAKAAERATIVKSGNMSMGVILLSVLVKQAARALEAADFDIEVLEMHHKHKVDAPSGTALLLGEAAAAGRQVSLDEKSVRVRDGHTGAREEGTIGFATLRGGSVVGDHTVILAGEGERIELTHKAGDRSIFALGAVKAGLWCKGKPAGLYSMLDVLGLSNKT